MFNECDGKEGPAEVHAGVQDPKGEARALAGYAVAAVARELGITERLLLKWVTRHQLLEGTRALHAEQAADIARVKRALAQKEEEVAILKKPTAYCLNFVVSYLNRNMNGPNNNRRVLTHT
ncbi:MAG: transposase [Methylotetracoccus sp.]